MINFFTKCFDAICSVFIVLNFIAFTIIGGYLGTTFDEPMMMVLCGIGGLAVAFFFNVFVFGFIGQIIEIKNNLEDLNSTDAE